VQKCGVSRYPELRSEEQMRNKAWDPPCPECKTPLKPLPTDEGRPLLPTSISLYLKDIRKKPAS